MSLYVSGSIPIEVTLSHRTNCRVRQSAVCASCRDGHVMFTPTAINPPTFRLHLSLSSHFLLCSYRLRPIFFQSWPHNKHVFYYSIFFYITIDFQTYVGDTSAILFIETEPRCTSFLQVMSLNKICMGLSGHKLTASAATEPVPPLLGVQSSDRTTDPLPELPTPAELNCASPSSATRTLTGLSNNAPNQPVMPPFRYLLHGISPVLPDDFLLSLIHI